MSQIKRHFCQSQIKIAQCVVKFEKEFVNTMINKANIWWFHCTIFCCCCYFFFYSSIVLGFSIWRTRLVLLQVLDEKVSTYRLRARTAHDLYINICLFVYSLLKTESGVMSTALAHSIRGIVSCKNKQTKRPKKRGFCWFSQRSERVYSSGYSIILSFQYAQMMASDNALCRVWRTTIF